VTLACTAVEMVTISPVAAATTRQLEGMSPERGLLACAPELPFVISLTVPLIHKALFTLHTDHTKLHTPMSATIVAENGDYSRRNRRVASVDGA